MRPIFTGKAYQTIKAFNFDELLLTIKNGDWFKTGDFRCYYRAIPSNVKLPPNVVLLECQSNTCNNKTKFFFNLEKSDSPDERIYAGKDLEKLICDRVVSWAKNMNPKTLRAFGGSSFKSYLNHIPREVLLKGDFSERLRVSLEKGFVERIESMPLASESDLDDVVSMVEESKKQLDNVVKKQDENQSLLEDNSRKKFDEAIEKTHQIFSK